MRKQYDSEQKKAGVPSEDRKKESEHQNEVVTKHNSKNCGCFGGTGETWPVMRQARQRRWNLIAYEVRQRNPGSFGMYTWSKHPSWGIQEIVLNLLSDFDKEFKKKKGRTEELWAIVETLARWLVEEPIEWPLMDDAKQYETTCSLIGYAFLSALNRIDREGELHKDSKYKDLSLMLALWLRLSDLYDDSWSVDGPTYNHPEEMAEIGGGRNWSGYIFLYAKAYDIPIAGTWDIDAEIEERWHSFKKEDEEECKSPRKAIDRFRWKEKVCLIHTPPLLHGQPLGALLVRLAILVSGRRLCRSFDLSTTSRYGVKLWLPKNTLADL